MLCEEDVQELQVMHVGGLHVTPMSLTLFLSLSLCLCERYQHELVAARATRRSVFNANSNIPHVREKYNIHVSMSYVYVELVDFVATSATCMMCELHGLAACIHAAAMPGVQGSSTAAAGQLGSSSTRSRPRGIHCRSVCRELASTHGHMC
jgi:hypothetical protein